MQKFTIFFFILLFAVNVNSQPRYSIDIEPAKNRRVPVSFFIAQTKEKMAETKEIRQRHKVVNKSSKKVKRHTYRIQTKEVRKRMRQTEQLANNFNQGKVPIKIRIKRLLKWMT